MGLDTVDIVITIEKKLGITLPNNELEKVVTVGDLHNIVLKNLTIKDGAKCKSQMVFYRLRRHLATTTDLSGQHFTTGSSLNNIFPKHQRRLAYAAIKQDVKLQLPSLALAPRWEAFLFNLALVTIGGGFAAAFVLVNFFSYSKWSLLLPCVGIALHYIVSAILNVKKTFIEQPTVREFVNETVALNYVMVASQTGPNKKEVEQLVNQIIADISGVDMHEITPSKKIGDDLGID